MQRLFASALVLAVLFTSLPCLAENTIPFKALEHSAGLLPNMANGQSSSSQPATRSHWTKGGKIMTYIGVPVMAAGGAMLAYGLKDGDSTSCSNNTCVSVSWKYTGAAWIGLGGVLTAIGLTRHSKE
ncbi:MAG: hypothetical protein WAN35_00085 [Terracidiphilus sp.]